MAYWDPINVTYPIQPIIEEVYTTYDIDNNNTILIILAQFYKWTKQQKGKLCRGLQVSGDLLQ